MVAKWLIRCFEVVASQFLGCFGVALSSYTFLCDWVAAAGLL